MDSPNEFREVAPGIFVVRAPGPPPGQERLGEPDAGRPPVEQDDLTAVLPAPLAAPPLPQPAQWQVSVAPPKASSLAGPAALNHKVLAAYPELCIGCRKCELACAEFHVGKPDAAYSRIRVTSIEEERRDFPTICMHCKIAKCERACPTKALYYDPKLRDVVVLNQSRCVRCLECVRACPFGAIWLSPDKEILKCDLCGGDPACVKVCPERPSRIPAHWPAGKKVSCLQYLAPDEVTLLKRLANLSL